MTVHAITGFIAPDSGMTEADVQTAVDDWVAARAKWESDWDATVSRSNTALDGTGVDYFQFAIRFEWSVDKANTLQKCADKFKTKVAWFRLVYHECEHDTTGPCSWDERWNWNDGSAVPPEIEPVVPDAPTTVNA